MKITDLQPGMIVYDCHKYRMDNARMTTWGLRTVRIAEVHADHVVASWNGNPAKAFYERSIKAWTKNPPVLVRTIMGSYRKETRVERTARLAAEKSKTGTNTPQAKERRV